MVLQTRRYWSSSFVDTSMGSRAPSRSALGRIRARLQIQQWLPWLKKAFVYCYPLGRWWSGRQLFKWISLLHLGRRRKSWLQKGSDIRPEERQLRWYQVVPLHWVRMYGLWRRFRPLWDHWQRINGHICLSCCAYGSINDILSCVVKVQIQFSEILEGVTEY